MKFVATLNSVHLRCALGISLTLLFNGFVVPAHRLAAYQQPSASSPLTSPLTVREIMQQPSIAGLRPEGEKISPDGSRVAFLWNAQGEALTRDLYVTSTNGGAAKLLARAVDVSPLQDLQDSSVRTEAGKQTGANKSNVDGAREEQAVRREGQVAEREGQVAEREGQVAEREGQVAERNEGTNLAQGTRDQSLSAVDWSPDNRRLLYTKNGDLYIVSADGGSTARRLTNTAAPEVGARWLAGSNRILYQTGENLFIIGVDEATLVQLTREGTSRDTTSSDSSGGSSSSSSSTPPTLIQRAITGTLPSDDGARVAYIVSDTSKQRQLFVPNYTGRFVTAPTVRRGWTEQRIEIVETNGNDHSPVAVKLPAPEGASYIRGLDWTAGNLALIVDRIDRDTKRRQLFLAVVAARDREATLIDEETDERWIAPLSRLVEPSPQGDAVIFASERDGFNHLYLKQLDPRPSSRSNSSGGGGGGDAPASERSVPASERSVAVRQLTGGKWEVTWFGWLPDNRQVVYSATTASTAERHFYLFDVKTGITTRLPTTPGMNVNPQLSKTGGVLLYEHSEWNLPGDLHALQVCAAGCERQASAKQLTDTVPPRFKQTSWVAPQFAAYTAKDGKPVQARVYLPRSFDKARKHPGVVFVHGAGYLQNIINGWNNYYREAMFHHLLVQRGYVVLDIDYRGSAGYGRQWRTDVHNFLGGLDLQDHLDGIDYIVKEYAVDRERVGIYGGSYGGFIAEMAAMRAPEQVRCAAALRPVADWRNYYASSPVYTTERLGFPEKNPEGYRRSSPITYAAQLKRPLLILHGMVDDNVHVIDSVRLIQKLIDLGKTRYFDAMLYPAENHAFTRPESWSDEYERILRFFEEHLKK